MKDSFPPGHNRPFASPVTAAPSAFERAPEESQPNPFLGVELKPAMEYLEKRDDSVSSAIASALTLPQQDNPVTELEIAGDVTISAGGLELFDAHGNPVEVFELAINPGDLCPCCGQVVPESASELVELGYSQRDSGGEQEDSCGLTEPAQLDSSAQLESWQESF